MKEVILHAKKSLLFLNGEAWNKRNGNLFDVTMGSYDGAEVCELVGLYLLYQMKLLFPNMDFGLYRDDGLGVHSNMPGPQLEKAKKELIRFFKDISCKFLYKQTSRSLTT